MEPTEDGNITRRLLGACANVTYMRKAPSIMGLSLAYFYNFLPLSLPRPLGCRILSIFFVCSLSILRHCERAQNQALNRAHTVPESVANAAFSSQGALFACWPK